MTDQPTPNECHGYEVMLTVRELDGALRFHCLRIVTWQMDAAATRDDGQWSQSEKSEALNRAALECDRELVTWARGQTL